MTSVDERGGQASLARIRGLIVAAITLLTGVALVAGITTSVAPLIIVFVLVCPGLALIGAVRLRDPLFEIVVGVALSVSIAGLLATMELFIDAWAPVPTISILLAISVAGLLLDAELIPRRLWVSVAARSSAAASSVSRRLGRRASGLEEPMPGAARISAASPASSATIGSVTATSSTASMAPAAPLLVRTTRPRTVPAMGPMLVTADAPSPPEPAEVPTSHQTPAPSDDRPSHDEVGPSASTPAPAGPPAGRGRKARTKDEGATPPPPPTLITVRRLPEAQRPKPGSPASRGRPKGGVADEEPEASQPTGSLRSAVRSVVGDLADHRDGKR